MAYCGYITTLKNVRKHPNADRLLLAECFGKTHIREGVVARIINRPKFTAFKHKNEEFKIIEGIVKDTAEAPDIEEAQEVELDN